MIYFKIMYFRYTRGFILEICINFEEKIIIERKIKKKLI